MMRWFARFLSAAFVVGTVALILASCANRGPTNYRDVSGADRGQRALEADVAQCRYEFEIARAGSSQYPVKTGLGGRFNQGSDQIATAIVSGTPRGLYDACIEARGWREVR